MIVRCYRNLHINKYSIQNRQPPKGWRLYSHMDSFLLRDVTFKVYENGRKKVIAAGRKAVHAFVIGSLDNRGEATYNVEGMRRVSYNPYRDGYFFYCDDGQRIESAALAVFTLQGVFVP